MVIEGDEERNMRAVESYTAGGWHAAHTGRPVHDAVTGETQGLLRFVPLLG